MQDWLSLYLLFLKYSIREKHSNFMWHSNYKENIFNLSLMFTVEIIQD